VVCKHLWFKSLNWIMYLNFSIGMCD
jgi:hypothetical protein